MQEKNIIPRKKGITINTYIARWTTLSCIMPIEEDSFTTVSRKRELHTTYVFNCANSSNASCSCSISISINISISISSASSSINNDSTTISDTFNTSISFVSSYTPLSKKQCFYFSI